MTMKTLLLLFVAFLLILATLQTNAETHALTVQANYRLLSRTESTPGRKLNAGASHDSVNNDVVSASAETTTAVANSDTADTDDHEANPSYRGNINGTNSPSSSTDTHRYYSDDRKPPARS
ncbi:hypothetical protein F2P56_014832 [Juglans regia]|uniref:Uncharacterized protein LOC109010798 n=2 Tax=Juglans regia TaxID=51240 RepID=A0A2I4GTN7_JUGRE|nr:uncharacterized protein LOC109010798 [Juglans regia]XP_018847258.1 uncharacterized protein LOC109010798 [Juglans regia]KAF5464780.1 hypothetical protein F2P56_014832 [Juglans regia]